MVRQVRAFLQGEGEAWLTRNKHKLPPEHDPLIDTMKSCIRNPRSILEVGCANGWRLDLLESHYDCEVAGIDPGYVGGHVHIKGSADDLSYWASEAFDVIIYGFCLYLVDREDLFKIVAEGDRVLEDRGFIVIYDFLSYVPHKRKYEHLDGLFSYKMDHAALWAANPSYSIRDRRIWGSGDDKTAVTILRKNVTAGWPTHD